MPGLADDRRSPLVEVLYVAGCPHWRATAELVTQVSRDLDVRAKLFVVEVHDVENAERRRFLGSPTVRVDGIDVEAGANERTEFSLACRAYETTEGRVELPPADWIRESLDYAARPAGPLVASPKRAFD